MYAFAGGEPVGRRDPTGEYAESGHYYTVLYVALRLGYSPADAQRMAFFSQIQDEIAEYDAIQNAWAAARESERNVRHLRNSYEATRRMRRNHPALHTLDGRYSTPGTSDAMRAALDAPGIPELGFQLHRLADTFAHRRLGKEHSFYKTGWGHGIEVNEGLSPDRIQRRPRLYLAYVRTLTSVLSIRRGVSDEKLSAEIVRGLMAVAYATSEAKDTWWNVRYLEDEAVEREAVATIRKLIARQGARNNQAKELENVLRYRPEQFGKHHRSISDVLREFETQSGRREDVSVIERAYDHALSVYAGTHD